MAKRSNNPIVDLLFREVLRPIGNKVKDRALEHIEQGAGDGLDWINKKIRSLLRSNGESISKNLKTDSNKIKQFKNQNIGLQIIEESEVEEDEVTVKPPLKRIRKPSKKRKPKTK